MNNLPFNTWRPSRSKVRQQFEAATSAVPVATFHENFAQKNCEEEHLLNVWPKKPGMFCDNTEQMQRTQKMDNMESVNAKLTSSESEKDKDENERNELDNEIIEDFIICKVHDLEHAEKVWGKRITEKYVS